MAARSDPRLVRLAAEIRCPACGRGGGPKHGQSLIAVVYTNGEREWLVMNPHTKPSPNATDERLFHERVTLRQIMNGTDDLPPLLYAAQLDWMAERLHWIVWDLGRPEQLRGLHIYASVLCPRCTPRGDNSSWLLDLERLAEHLSGRLDAGEVVKVSAAEIAVDGRSTPTPDHLLHLRRPPKRPETDGPTP